MTRLTFLSILILLCFSAPTLASPQKREQSKKCMDTAQTQDDLNSCAATNFRTADDELNRVYQAVLKKYAADPVLINKLKAAQRAWLSFRDAELGAQFPSTYYGSVQPMCESMLAAELTEGRIKQLKVWLEGIEEGDVCAGAIAMKEKKSRNAH